MNSIAELYKKIIILENLQSKWIKPSKESQQNHHINIADNEDDITNYETL